MSEILDQTNIDLEEEYTVTDIMKEQENEIEFRGKMKYFVIVFLMIIYILHKVCYMMTSVNKVPQEEQYSIQIYPWFAFIEKSLTKSIVLSDIE